MGNEECTVWAYGCDRHAHCQPVDSHMNAHKGNIKECEKVEVHAPDDERLI